MLWYSINVESDKHEGVIEMTEKQAAYREALISRAIADWRHTYAAMSTGRMQVAEALAPYLALPMPQTVAEASKQIDLIKSSFCNDRDYKRAAIARVRAMWPTFEDHPADFDAIYVAIAALGVLS